MKKVLFLLALCATTFSASAASFTFKPNDGSGNTADMFDLDHYYAYSWGVSGASADTLRDSLVSGGQQIVSVKLTIWNVWDWTVENDILNIHLLDDPAKGITSIYDNQSGGDYFAGKGPFLTSWTDPKGGDTSDKTFDFIYNFTTGNINSLTSFILDSTATGMAMFGLGFDPDCHYYNDGIQLDIVTAPKQVPDGALSVSLLGLGLLSLAAFRRFFR
jgi:hypothetical protein